VSEKEERSAATATEDAAGRPDARGDADAEVDRRSSVSPAPPEVTNAIESRDRAESDATESVATQNAATGAIAAAPAAAGPGEPQVDPGTADVATTDQMPTEDAVDDGAEAAAVVASSVEDGAAKTPIEQAAEEDIADGAGMDDAVATPSDPGATEGIDTDETTSETGAGAAPRPEDAAAPDRAQHHDAMEGGADAADTTTDPVSEDGGSQVLAAADGAAEADGTDSYEPPPRASAELKAILEALIFASPEPLSLKALTRLLDSEPKEDVAIALTGLKEDYERPGGLQLVEVAGGYQIVTRHDLHEWVRRLFHERSTQKLSAQALETLAVVAYRQPITAVEITEIRGVNTSGVLNTLLERHLIKIVGRKAVVGRPFMYSTTKEFLIRFGLNDLTDLPRVEDMVDALGLEAPLLVERAPLEDQLPLEEPDGDSDEAQGEFADTENAEDPADAGSVAEPGEPEDRGGPGGMVH
jgi:segregation and condensation protein B